MYALHSDNSHRPLDELSLQLAFLCGVKEAAPQGQSSAGLWRVELNDGQWQTGKGRRAERESHSVTIRGPLKALQLQPSKHTLAPLFELPAWLIEWPSSGIKRTGQAKRFINCDWTLQWMGDGIYRVQPFLQYAKASVSWAQPWIFCFATIRQSSQSGKGKIIATCHQ